MSALSYECRHKVTLIDRQNHHLFQPLLYQVATAGLSAPDIAQPIRSILAGKANLKVRMERVIDFDLTAEKVVLETSVIDYDYLVLAMGGVTSYFGHNEWQPFARGLKSLDDALAIRRDVLLAFEHAEIETDLDRQKQLMTVVVVGGGPTGVELAGAFAELTRNVLSKDFEQIDPRRARIVLVEAGARLLSNFPEDLSASARRQLEALGVEVKTDTRVTAVRAGEIELAGVTLRAGTIILGGGRGGQSLDPETWRPRPTGPAGSRCFPT